jgi:hypothetical protein
MWLVGNSPWQAERSLVRKASTYREQLNLPAACGKLNLAMLRRTWYSRLARTNRLIAEARQRIALLKVHITQLEHEGQSTGRALARLRQLEVALQLLVDQRVVILERVRRSQLPVDIM